MTLDNRSEAERRYDMERDGTLYSTQPEAPAKERSPLYHELITWIDAHFANEDTDTEAETLTADEETVLNIILKQQPAKPADTPIGTLPTGETIYGVWDWEGHTGVVGTHIAGKYVTADDEGFLTVYMGNCTIEGASRAELAEMRRVLDAADLLFDAAGKWGNAE